MLPTIAVPPLPFGLVGGDRIQATTSRGQIDYVDDGCERERRDLRQQVIWQRQELHVDFVDSSGLFQALQNARMLRSVDPTRGTRAHADRHGLWPLVAAVTATAPFYV
jgi:hypothetical protein